MHICDRDFYYIDQGGLNHINNYSQMPTPTITLCKIRHEPKQYDKRMNLTPEFEFTTPDNYVLIQNSLKKELSSSKSDIQ